jgi:hypothetical protein
MTNRLRIALVASLLAPCLTGCGLISFDIGQDIPAQTVPGSPVGALVPASLFSIPLNIDIASEVASHGTGPAKSVTLSSLTLTVTQPAGGTFDFLTSITISISASGLPDQQIAALAPVPGTATISIPPTPGVNLLPYINAGATIKASAAGHLPAQDTTFTGHVVVTVHV